MKRIDGATQAMLVVLAVPILVITAMQFYQVRWGILGLDQTNHASSPAARVLKTYSSAKAHALAHSFFSGQ